MLPFVSCVMPTRNRRRFAAQAIRYFELQDYVNKELVILDDGADSISDLAAGRLGVRYVRLNGQRTLGAKRNACVEESRGDLILHWDDDDWMAGHRISYQVQALLEQKGEVCGLTRMLFHEPASGQTWLYEYPPNRRPWLAGGSLLYSREFWRRSPFPDVQVASDTRFILNRKLGSVAVPADYRFYVAMIHEGNTSPKVRSGSCWSRWANDVECVLGEDTEFYRSLRQSNTEAVPRRPPEYTILTVVHNGLEMVQLATLRTLRHCSGQSARLLVVDNGSTDGTREWLDLLSARGDIDLIRSAANIGHGPAIEMARRSVRSPYLVTLDSDAFPLSDNWLTQLRARLVGEVKVTGILHHRGYIHPSCLMIANETLREFGLTFLNERGRPRLDVAERISCEINHRGYRIGGLQRTGAERRGSVSEPVYLGSEYEGLVHHQWYTTRASVSGGAPVDDVPSEDQAASLCEVLARYNREPRELTVVVGVRAGPGEPERLRNARACLRVLNLQDLERWRYRIVVVEQDETQRLKKDLGPLTDVYVFARNAGAYNRGWAFNIGAKHAGGSGALCLIDGDLLVPPDFLRRGLAEMQAGRRAIQPFREIVYLSASATTRVIADRLSGNGAHRPYEGRVFRNSQGGCIWVDACLYSEIGGHDERFRGWGREDREFWDRLERSTPIERWNGRLLHLDHPRPAMADGWAAANQKLYAALAAGGISEPCNRIGELDRYAHEEGLTDTVPAVASQGARDWENWHHWDVRRIERIVRDEKALGTSSRFALAEIVASLGASLLDAGCGPGALWTHLEGHRSGLSWKGVDVTRKMIAAAHRLFPQVPVCQADIGSLPFGSGTFDVVLLRHVLEYVPPWLMEAALREAARVARRSVAIDFHVPPAREGPRRSIRAGDFTETCWTIADLDAPIAQSGWRLRERLSMASGARPHDELWILMPPEEAAALDELARTRDSDCGPRISIIMPTYRRAHTILRTVAMIRAQTHRNWELIIIDNAGDGGYYFADPRVRVYTHAERPSASYARNQGVRHATGELLCFFDDDDNMSPEYLERMAAAFAAHPHAKMVRCGMRVSSGGANFTYATPECCLRREYAVSSWEGRGPGQDQRYFSRIVTANRWSEQRGDIVVVREVLCQANTDPRGGLRSGRY